MQLVDFTFPATRATGPRFTWRPDPVSIDASDEPAWAVWETECRTLVVEYCGATDTYKVGVAEVRLNGKATVREVLWSGVRHASLGDAMAAAERLT